MSLLFDPKLARGRPVKMPCENLCDGQVDPCQCVACGHVYDTPEEAEACYIRERAWEESRP